RAAHVSRHAIRIPANAQRRLDRRLPDGTGERHGAAPMKKILLLATALLAVPAARHTANEPQQPQPPANEVWVTPKEIREVAITTDVVQARSVGDPLIATGRVEFSDTRVAHVF